MEYTIIVTGAPEVGKTSFIDRVHFDQFSYEYTPTIKKYEILMEGFVDNIYTKLHIWDIPGKKCTTSKKYIDADGMLIFYDLMRLSTMETAQKIIKMYPNIPHILCANKCDLCMIDHSDTMSAKTGFNTQLPYLKIVRLIRY